MRPQFIFLTAPSRFAVLFLAIMAISAQSHAQTRSRDESTLQIHRLKQHYLKCEHSAQTPAEDFNPTAVCSDIYETLKSRAFGGDPVRIHAWAKRELTRRAARS